MSETDTEVINWRSRPVTDEFPASLLFVVVFFAACFGAARGFGGVGYGVIAGLLLLVSMGRYLLATGFVLDGKGVTVRYCGQSRTIPWSEIKSASEGPKGVFLSPYDKPSRLDSFRGVLLRFAKNNSEEVISFVRNKIQDK